MVNGHKIEIWKEDKKIFVSDGIFNKSDVEKARKYNSTPKSFITWIPKLKLNSYINEKVKDGYNIKDYYTERREKAREGLKENGIKSK